MAREARETADDAVTAILSGDRDAAINNVSELYHLVQGGVRLTAEAVEDTLIGVNLVDAEWVKAIVENESPCGPSSVPRRIAQFRSPASTTSRSTRSMTQGVFARS